MAEWKKVIVSGSSAELTHVTASKGIQITNIATTAANTENVLVVDSSGNVKKATQATVAGAISQAHAYATTSIDNTATSQFTSVGTVLSASVNSNITYVNNGNIALSVSASVEGDFLGIKAVTKSIVAGTNITLTPSAASTTINAVTKSIVAGENIEVSLSGTNDTIATIKAVTKSIVAGENVTVTLSGTNDTIATIKAATSSVVAPGSNITVTPSVNANGGTVYSISSTAFSPADSANFDNITATGNVSASGKTAVHTFGGTATFNTISASKLNIETLTELNTDTVINGGLVFNGFELFEDQIVIRTGSTQFGVGASSSLQSAVTHTFTGSVFITGSNLTLTDGTVTATAFSGDGANITGIVANNVALNTLTAGNGLAASAGHYDGGTNTTFSVNAGTGLSISGDDVIISNAGVTETQLATSVAGTGLAGGGGTALSVDLNEVGSEVVNVAADSIVFIDANDNGTKKDTIVDLVASIAGDGIGAASGVLNVDVSEFAGTGLKDEGSENLALDIDGLTNESTVAQGDYIAIYDVSAGAHRKTTIINALDDVLGTGFGIDGSVITFDPSTFADSSVPLASLASDELTIGTTTIVLGTTEHSLAGLQGLDLTAANHTIFAGVGSHTLEIGAAATTVDIPGDLVVDGALTVAGNFTVTGTVTTVNTETLSIEDNFIDLNSNFSGSSVGAPSQDAGLSVKRGNLADANLYWDETKDRWSTSHTNLAGAATDAAVTAYLATAVSATSNPVSAPVDGADSAAKAGQLHVNTSTQEIWIYA